MKIVTVYLAVLGVEEVGDDLVPRRTQTVEITAEHPLWPVLKQAAEQLLESK